MRILLAPILFCAVTVSALVMNGEARAAPTRDAELVESDPHALRLWDKKVMYVGYEKVLTT